MAGKDIRIDETTYDVIVWAEGGGDKLDIGESRRTGPMGRLSALRGAKRTLARLTKQVDKAIAREAKLST